MYNFEKTINIFLEIIKLTQITNLERAAIYDYLCSLVCNYGSKKYLDLADLWSTKAMILAENVSTIKGTRGSILVELGKYQEGKELLLPLTKPEFEPTDRVMASCYLAKAEHFLRNSDEAKNWLILAKEIDPANPVIKRIELEINQRN